MVSCRHGRRKCLQPSVLAVAWTALLSFLLPSLGRAYQPDIPSQDSVIRGSANAPLVFRGVIIVDVTGGKLIPAQTVVVVGDRIQAVGPARSITPPRGAQVVDAKDKYLMPGLWDMHAHVSGSGDVAYPSFVAHGVTGIRIMAQPSLDSMHHWKREIAVGARVGPRIIGTGPMIPGTEWPLPGWMRTAKTPEEGRYLVDSLQTASADFIKVYADLSRATYFAIAAEARRAGIPIAGHITDSVTPAEAADSGQRSFEHLWVLGQSGCTQEIRDSGKKKLLSINEAQCVALGTHMAKRETALVPTFTVARILNFCGLRNMGSSMKGMSDSDRSNRYSPGYVDILLSSRDTVPDRCKATTRAIGILRRAGVMFLAGTDDPSLAHGATLHFELMLLVEDGGLTPLEALRAATVNPAKYFGATDSLGIVAPGKLADLVLLDANPLTDIRNTAKIHAVVAGGRYFNRAALDQLLAEVKARAQTKP